MNVIVVEGVDPAGVSAAADFINPLNETERHFPAVMFEDRENGPELFRRKTMFLSDLVFLNDQKRPV